MTASRGRPKRRVDEAPKPTRPISVSPQRCYVCDKLCVNGDAVIVHRVNPVIGCLACWGEKEAKSEFLCHGIIGT